MSGSPFHEQAWEGQVASAVALKGESPGLYYPFTLTGIYETIPSLSVKDAYRELLRILDRADRIVADHLGLRQRLSLPMARDQAQAAAYMAAILDPFSYPTQATLKQSAAIQGLQIVDTLKLEGARPFPLRLASPAKLSHSFRWIDANVKVQIEKALLQKNASREECRIIANCALSIYSYILKHEQYSLALAINFNHSMFIQDRVLSLLLGPRQYLASDSLLKRSRIANDIALRYLEQLAPVSEKVLCKLSVFMGIVWTNSDELQEAYLEGVTTLLSEIETRLRIAERPWCIDHTDSFLSMMNTSSGPSAMVVLDDNGESIFDLALFQSLMQGNPRITLTFLVNKFPVSTNISLDAMSDILDKPYFRNLRQEVARGRASILVEEQPFRSFEQSYLTRKSREAVQESDVLYVKGANFFETFQITYKHRFYALAVQEFTTRMLTGCTEGSGIFVELMEGQDGYSYRSSQDMTPLSKVLSAR
jgi:uncharacterized protein with ATP-grasp and redox domains